ncbi:hypothetical protein EJ08DRAFT_71333 [Tothia fuscella]|uniref:Uncharacterized protein n=1 Tax=Tothia fuscella TaxID=1048955 RepID=A0A9P4NEU1_9PEZI|nr:hypothetical protein EJ08DRAFT_71333 [Tothia fuscella]
MPSMIQSVTSTRLRALDLLQTPQPAMNSISKTVEDLDALYRGLKSSLQSASNSHGESEIYGAVLLELQLLQPMVLLCTLALQLPANLDRTDSPIMCCPSICQSVLSQWEMLDPEQSEWDSISNSIACKLIFTLHDDEFIRASYMACFYFKLAGSEQQASSPRRSQRGLGTPEIPSSAVKHLIKDMIKSFVKLAPDLRAKIKHVIGLVMCVEVMGKRVSLARREEFMKSSFRQLLDQCRYRCGAGSFHNSDAVSTDLDIFIREPGFEGLDEFAMQDYFTYPNIVE